MHSAVEGRLWNYRNNLAPTSLLMSPGSGTYVVRPIFFFFLLKSTTCTRLVREKLFLRMEYEKEEEKEEIVGRKRNCKAKESNKSSKRDS